MGHACLGARSCYGDGVGLVTLSLSERHSGLVFRLSRRRKRDVGHVANAAEKAERQRIYSRDWPPLEAETEDCVVDLPEYHVRRRVYSQDPLAVVHAFLISVRVVFARLFGFRMCPMCPRCNATDHPCQNRFGSNMLPMGGIFGGAEAAEGAVEH